ncbi:hypothetical protein BKA12_000236 [Neomicrococcus lactis]|uniref:Uncharacterized protein n=1 Tax=Neomicrococcus lactis TaxID=732241 RepID=A0A7W9DAL2_9MICC|nr:hypothetical protein [Neomicrococcus lactis]MBB5597156.1 hypothetical protein [Neomicrococcus lactis]
MSFTDLAQHGISKEVVPSFSERSPRLDLNTVLTLEGMIRSTLEEQVSLDLVDGRENLIVVNKVHESVRIEVGNANSTSLPDLANFLRRSPLAVVVTVRLVNQIQIDVVHSQPLQ